MHFIYSCHARHGRTEVGIRNVVGTQLAKGRTSMRSSALCLSHPRSSGAASTTGRLPYFQGRSEGALRTCKFPCTSADRTGLVGGGVLDAPSRKAAVFAKACLLPCRVLRDCHVGLRPPRNDKSVCLTPPNYRLNTCNCLGRSLSAATDAIGACHFNDSLYQLAAVRRERHAAPPQCTTGDLA